MSDRPIEPADEDPLADLPPEVADVLRGLSGGQVDPTMASMFKEMGLGDVDPAMLQMVGSQVQAMFAGAASGPVNQEAATDLARKAVAAQGDPSVSAAQQHDTDQALDVARLWLDAVTEFPAHDVGGRAWSRADWVEATMPVWCDLVEPVARGVSSAITGVLTGQLGELQLPEGMLPSGVDPAAAIGPMMERMSSGMFSMQLGQAVGALAADVVSGTEVALPLVPDGQVVLLPTNLTAFADGVGIDTREVRLYVAIRESARVRLFGAVPWLRAGLVAAVRDYARDISIDTDRIEATLQGADMSDPAALQQALQDNLFTPDPSAAQQAALGRLETLLALVEGWVDTVTDRAITGKLPHAVQLGEAVRRRRATGGPAERTFSALVGLELRPRRLRDAANLWAALEDRLGAEGRDAAWRHPDLAPSAADLDDILGYVDRAAGGGPPDDMDAALDALLRQGEADGPPA